MSRSLVTPARRAPLRPCLALCIAALASASAPARAGAPSSASTASAARPADGAVLHLPEVLESLERHYPLLLAARQERAAAEGELLAARGVFDPVLRARVAGTLTGKYTNLRSDALIEQPTPLWGSTLFAGWRLGQGDFAVYDGKLATNANGELRAGLSVPLWRNGPTDRRRANIDRAVLGLPLADLSIAEQRLAFRRQASVRYWEWVAAGRRREIAQALLVIARERDQALQARVAAGDVPEIERTDNQRALVQREGLLVAADRQLRQAAIELSLYLRRPDGAPLEPEPLRLPAELPAPALSAAALRDPAAQQEDLRLALSRRPEVRRQQALREQQQVELRLSRNQQAPAIDVAVSVSQDLGPGAPLRGRPEVESSVLFDLPLLLRSARGRVQVVEAGLARLSAQQRLVVDRVIADVNDARSALLAASEREGAARREADLAQRLAAGERTRFDLGESTLLFVNLREQQAAEAALRVVDALLDYHRALAAYQAALAAPQ